MTSSSNSAQHFTINSVELYQDNSDLVPFIGLTQPHILEQIFDLLDINDLLNCRLVSHQWLLFAQRSLQSKITLGFFANFLILNNYLQKSKRLKALTKLLRKKEFLQNYEDCESIPISFPCNRFSFNYVGLNNNHLQSFLNTNGQNIRELYLDSSQDCPCHYFFMECENDVIDLLASLLFHQTPNIKILHLNIRAIVEWKIKDVGNRSRWSNFPLQRTDPEYKDICQKASNHLLQSKTIPSLKVIKLNGGGLPKILEFMIRISPKLEKIILDAGDYKLLLEPENRAHMLKTLEFSFDLLDSCNQDMELISQFDLKLQRIKLDLDNVHLWVKKNQDFESRVVNTINRLLAGSWDTLEEIIFDNVLLLTGIKFPECMPKVREFKIIKRTNPLYNVTGCSIQTTLPKLHTVSFRWMRYCNENCVLSDVLNLFNYGAEPHEPLSTSVRRVGLYPIWIVKKCQATTGVSNCLQKIQRWFPNARIESA